MSELRDLAIRHRVRIQEVPVEKLNRLTRLNHQGVVAQIAPAVRLAVGDKFGFPKGTNTMGKLVAALRLMGFDKVYDTNFAADLTIMEEGTELLGRIQNGGTLPMITSCSPGWINYAEYNYGDLLGHLSSCKSPHQMQGAIIKSYYAEKNGLDPKDIFVVSIMPCTAKKMEAVREDSYTKGEKDTDAVITTTELIRMIKNAGIAFDKIESESCDMPFGIGSGAGLIFGATGGVMEAALRTAYELITGSELENIDLHDVRGMEGIKEASYTVGGMEIKLAVVSGTANAEKLLNKVKAGEADYHFIEVMGCPGGCVNGGGQPYQPASVRNFSDVRALRAAGLYNDDENLPVRKSHQNPDIKAIYDEFFGEPGSHKAHDILHTGYTERKVY